MSERERCKLCGEYRDGRIAMRKHLTNDHSSTERFDALHETAMVEDTQA